MIPTAALKGIVGLLVASSVMLANAGCGPSSRTSEKPSGNSDTVTYARIAPSASSWPQIVASKKGFWEENNIKFDLVELDASEGVSALQSGSIQAMFLPCDYVMSADMAGAKLKIVAAIQDENLGALVAGSGISSFDGLRGKTIATESLTSGSTLLLKRLLAKHGLNESDYDLVAAGGTSSRLQGMVSKSYAATWLLQPGDFKVADEQGATILGRFNEVAPVFEYGCIVMQDDWSSSHADTATSFLKAFSQGMQWLHNPANKNSAIKMLSDETKVGRSVATKAYELMFVENPGTFPKYGEVSVPGLQASAKLLEDSGSVKGSVGDVTQYVDGSYLHNATGKDGVVER